MKTSYYANLKNIDIKKYIPVAISGDEGRLVGFQGKAMRELSPYPFYKKWKASEDEIERKLIEHEITIDEYKKLKEISQNHYINKFYNIVLKKLNPKDIADKLENCVMLCFEKPNKFCHRFLVASWLEINLDIKIDEYGFENDIEVNNNKANLKKKLQVLMEEEKGLE